MALTPSGTISMSDINTALNRSSTASISFNDEQVRFLANQDTGSVVIDNMRNKQSTVGTIVAGRYQNEKSGAVSQGYGINFIGSITSANTFFGYTLHYVECDTPNQNLIGAPAGNTLPNITARMRMNGQTKAMSLWNVPGSRYIYRNVGDLFFPANINVNGLTFAFQFAQT